MDRGSAWRRAGIKACLLGMLLPGAQAWAQPQSSADAAPATDPSAAANSETPASPPAATEAAAPSAPPVLEVIPVPAGQQSEAKPGTRESEATELEEVIVTSQKTKQTLREVPASVSSISGQQMRDSKILSPGDVNGYVPNTQLKVSPFAGEIRIRGYGTSPSNVGFEPSVGLIIDDVYYGRSGFLSALQYDIDRFEVIRGPQGALFGKNTVAGVINITTVDADSTTAGDLTIFARDDLGIRDVRGGVSVPLADDIYSRVSGALQIYNGLYYNTDLNRKEADLTSDNGRAKLRFTNLFGQGQLRLAVSSGNQNANANLFQLSKASPATLALFKQYDPRVEASAYNNTLSSNVPSRVDVDTDTATANFQYPFTDVGSLDKLDLTVISAYGRNNIKARTIDFDFSPVPVARLDLARPTPYDQFSQEFRLSGSAPSMLGFLGRTEFVGGLYYLRSHLVSNDIARVEDLGAAGAFVIAARGNGPLTGVSPELAQEFGTLLGMLGSSPADAAFEVQQTSLEHATLLLDQYQQAFSGYGQITSYLTESFAVVLGGRVGYETKKAHQSSQAPVGAIFIPAILGQSNFDSQGHRKETEESPKAGVKYDVNKHISTYFMWAKGFKGGGYNALPFNNKSLDYGPENANTFETGIKTRLFDNTLDANLALYRTNFKNLQVSVFDGTTQNVENAASARSQGFEADFRWLSPFPGTQLIGTAGYSHAYYLQYHNGPTQAEQKAGDPRVVDCTNPDGSTETSASGQPVLCQDLTGQTLASAPRWSASLIPTLSLPGFSPTTGFQFQVEGLYTSQRYLDVDLDPNVLQKANLTLNARISYGARNGAWSFSLFGSNLTDSKVLAQVTDEPVAAGNFGAIRQDRGREYYGAIKLDFE